MRTLRGWVLFSLSAGVLLAACGRTSLSVPRGGATSSGAGGAGGAGGDATTSAATTSAASTTASTTAASSTTSAVSASASATTGAGGGPTCTPEICDGIDNDCDGQIDEGCLCTPGSIAECYSGPADTLGVGACKQGQHSCNADGLGFGPCTGEIVPQPEQCNGLDDSCDGVVDEGCTTGCSDGTREGFVNVATYPKIAGCSGGFSFPGILGALTPKCALGAGNSGSNPAGTGCGAADLCAAGFHVCSSAADVATSSPTGCNGAATTPGLFFATRQSSTGCNLCALGNLVDPVVCNGCSCNSGCQQTALTGNDLFGCGSVGTIVSTCSVLDRASANDCDALGAAWSCNGPGGGCDEASIVTKSSSQGGGVLCCAD